MSINRTAVVVLGVDSLDNQRVEEDLRSNFQIVIGIHCSDKTVGELIRHIQRILPEVDLLVFPAGFGVGAVVSRLMGPRVVPVQVWSCKTGSVVRREPSSMRPATI